MRSPGTTLAIVLAPIVALCGGAAACGSEEPAPAGWVGNAADAAPYDANIDVAWPTADPDPDAGLVPGATFDAGDSGATSAFSCTGKTFASGDRTLTFTSGGIVRVAYIHVPNGYDAAQGTMLVLNFHGFSNSALIQRTISRMDKSSDQHGYIVVYPEGVATSWNAGDCCGTAWVNAVDDVQFVRDLVQKLLTDYCVDPKRVFSTGYSNGGFLSYRLACEMADTFAAIAPVAGQLGIPPTSCNPVRKVPLLEFHGTADPIVPYQGGTPIIGFDLGPVPKFRSVTESVGAFVLKNGCLGLPSTIYQKGDATCTQWGLCQADVVHCKIDAGGHTWPGGVPIPLVGKTSTDIGATETMYDFFVAHPMP
ncbi:PHB depolymerase family esterase [soil metagenome]